MIRPYWDNTRALHRWNPGRNPFKPRGVRYNWTVAGAAVGAGVGSLAGGVGMGPGAQIGATIGSLIDAFTAKSAPSLSPRRYPAAEYGTPINRLWGTARLECQIVWVGRNSDGTYMHEVDEGKKNGTEQHWFATFNVMVAETGFTYPDGTQHERPITIDMIWMADQIVWKNPATVATIPNWNGATTYEFGDLVLATDDDFYSSLQDGNVGLNPAGLAYPNNWQRISNTDLSIDHVMHPGPAESTFTMAASSTISGWGGGSYVSAMRGTTNFDVLNMDTYNIGNAIPQNVSVSCHTAAVQDGDVIYDLCRLCGVPTTYLNFADLTNPCTGFVQNNRTSGREMLTNFCIAKSIDLVEIDGVITGLYRGGPSVVTIPDGDLGASLDGKPGDRLPVEILADYRELHSAVQVRYKSASQWFRTVDVTSPPRGDALSENLWAFDTGMSLGDDEAVQMACKLADVEWLELGGKFGPLELPDTYAYLAPGCPFTANDNGIPTRFRITELDWVPGKLTLMAARDELEVLNQNVPGDSGLSPILPGQGSVAAFVVASPAKDATNQLASFPGFYVWIMGVPKSVPVTVYYSFDGFATAGIKAGTYYPNHSVFGLTSGTALADATAPGYETVSLTNVTYMAGTPMKSSLTNITESTAQNGGQWALIDEEWVAIVDVGAAGSPQQIGPGLIRGQRGSPYTGHVIGELFAACNVGNLIKIQVSSQYIGSVVYVQAVTPQQQLGDSYVRSCTIANPALLPTTPYQEVPAGVVDGVNTVFTLTNYAIAATLHFYVNGALVTGWALAGNSVTLATAPPLLATVYASYNY